MIKQFFLMACLVLITGSFLLLWDSPPESFLRPDSSKVENLPSADSYMSNIKSFIFSDDGSKKYILKAHELAIFSEFSELKLSQPVLTAFQKDHEQPQFEVKADTGILSKNSYIFAFDGNVNAHWDAKNGKTVMQAGNLSFSLKQDSASAKGGVQLKTPDSEISGDSLSANINTKVIKIKSRVRGVHDAI
jgi:LPS export ABC transporter protein LptC